MKIVKAELRSISPYSQSRKVQSEKKSRESADDFEKRSWKERCHVTAEGNLFIPGMQFSNSVKEACKYLNIQIEGQGKSTYTKNFEAGVMVINPLVLPLKLDDIQGEWVYVPSNGQRGGGKRVDKCFPLIPKWGGVVEYMILDDIITEEVFRRVLTASGTLIGVGRFRPRNCGFYGRFEIKSIKMSDVEL